MNRFLLFLLAASVSISLIGCNRSETEQTGAEADNAADTTFTQADNAAEQTGNAAVNAGEQAGNATENAAGRTGEAGTDLADKAGNAAENVVETASNAGVTAKVKNALLLSPVTQQLADDINVDTTDTQIILRGHTHTEQEKAEAERLAKTVAANRTVVNQIQVTTH